MFLLAAVSAYGNPHISPGSSLAHGGSDAVPESTEAVSRSEIVPRKPDVTSEAFFPRRTKAAFQLIASLIPGNLGVVPGSMN
jgi:hypothetical protein